MLVADTLGREHGEAKGGEPETERRHSSFSNRAPRSLTVAEIVQAFADASKMDAAVFCTCGIYPTGGPSVPDPRTAWRHLSHCSHASREPRNEFLEEVQGAFNHLVRAMLIAFPTMTRKQADAIVAQDEFFAGRIEKST